MFSYYYSQDAKKRKKCKKNTTRSDAKGRSTRQCNGLQPILHSLKTLNHITDYELKF